MNNVDVYLTPNNDGAESEENSGDEDRTSSIENLSERQLQAKAIATS